MSSLSFNLLFLAFFCQAVAIASSAHGEKRKLVRTEKGKRQEAVAHQDSVNVALELGSSGRLIRSAKASHEDAHLQTVEAYDLASASTESASIGARQSQEDQTEARTMGAHSDAFTKAHDALANELKQKQAALNDWLSRNCISSKETQLNNKKKELSDYQGANANAWWKSAWSWIKRTYQNLFNDTENRLKREVASLQAQLNAMKAEKAALERQVTDMQTVKNNHHGEANKLLKGLNSQVSALGTDLASFKSDKTAAQTAHNELKGNMIAEHAAAAAVFTEVIGNLDTAIHKKRDVFYSVSATCGQYEKEGKNQCNKCTSDQRACGDSCISKSDQCNLMPGCACDDAVGHDLHQDYQETKTAIEETIKYHETEINMHTDLLEQNDKDLEKMQTDKENADKAFDAEQARLEAYKTQLQKDKSTAEDAKQTATDALSHATDENEAAVTQLSDDLRAAIEKLKASQDEEKASKSALLIAQEATMKELLETHAATIAGWDAKIQETQTEKATLSSEASDLSAAIASASGDL